MGEGKLVAVFTVAGILVGTYTYGALRSGASAPTAGAPRRAAAS